MSDVIIGFSRALQRLVRVGRDGNIGALIIMNTIWGVPCYKYGTMGPKTLFQLLRPLHYRSLIDPFKGSV